MVLGVKNLPTNTGAARDTVSIPGSGRSPAERNGNPLQYFCLENSMDRGGWWATESDMGCTHKTLTVPWPLPLTPSASDFLFKKETLEGPFWGWRQLPCWESALPAGTTEDNLIAWSHGRSSQI